MNNPPGLLLPHEGVAIQVYVLKFVHCGDVLNFLKALYPVSLQVQAPEGRVEHQVRKGADLVESDKEFFKRGETAQA